ncbi:E3 ubiquitin-protein ligase RNF212B-like isoform X2 [Amblyomma americanum]
MNKLVYCNNCFAQPTRTSLFFVTTCAHVFCQGCKEDCTRSKCKICNATCSTASLSQNMSADVRELFKDPKIIMQRAMMISGFQLSQLSGLSAYLRQQVNSLKVSLKAATDNEIKYKQENERLRKEVAALKSEVKELKDQQSPGINISESPTFLAQPDYPIPPAFEQPTAAPPVARMEDFGQRTLGMQNFSGGAIGYTPSRRTTAMMASTDLSQQRGHRTYAHDDQPASRMGVAQATLAFGSSTRERRSLPGSDSSLSSIRFWTQNTDSHSRFPVSRCFSEDHKSSGKASPSRS